MLEFLEWLVSNISEQLYLKKNNGRYSVSMDKKNWVPIDKGVAKMLKDRLKIQTTLEVTEDEFGL